jgi:hypothetical protein
MSKPSSPPPRPPSSSSSSSGHKKITHRLVSLSLSLSLSPPPKNTPTAAADADTDAARQEIADALANPAAAFERYLTVRLGEANATLASALAGRGGSGSGSGSLPSAAVADSAENALPPSLRVLVPAMSSGAERARRQAVFRANLRRADALNKAALRAARRAGTPAADAPVYGLTAFSHLTSDEFRRLYLGKPFAQLKGQVDMSGAEDASAVHDDNAAAHDDEMIGHGAHAEPGSGLRRRRRRRRLAQTASALQCNKKLARFPYGTTNPPATFDWRNVKGTSYVTPVRDQQACASCVSFSTVVALEAISIRRRLAASRTVSAAGTSASSAVDLAEQDFLNCWNPTTDECQGALPSWYADRAVCKGVASERDVPYAARDANACAQVARDKLGLKGWYHPPVTDKGLKQAVFKSAPVAVAILAENSFGMYRGGVLPCGVPGAGRGVNHAVAVVGWDATSFVVKNSWGANWGDAGYVRLASGCARGKSSLNMHTSGYNVGVSF